MKCGLCLPHCPTYALRQHEAESPRGRIALIQGLLSGDLQANETLISHLDHCLHCLNCSGACPSGVDYSAIIDAGKARLPARRNPKADVLARLARSAISRGVLGWLRNSPMYAFGQRWTPRRWRGHWELLPRLIRERPMSPFAESAHDTTLFLGCVSRLTDQPIIQAFLSIASRLGIGVSVPSEQGCCGAMHGHGGNLAKAEAYHRRNIHAFAGARNVVSLASGCGGYLCGYLGDRVVDGSDFLVRWPWPKSVGLDGFDGVVAIHSPCSLRNSLKSEHSVFQLVERVPGARVVPLTAGHGCCGGGGLHLIEEPETAQLLLEPMLDQIRQLRPAIVLTSNTGCRLHLMRGLRVVGLDIPVLHPVEFIAERMSSGTL